MQKKKYLDYGHKQEKLASHTLRAVMDCHKGDMATYTIHTIFPGGIPASIIVTPAKGGEAALLSWFMWGRPAGHGRVSLRTWRWVDLANHNPAKSHADQAKLENLIANPARLAA
jgi:hypothetical protein